MRILITTGIYPPDIGGPATYSKILFDELPKKGIRVEVLSFGLVRHLPKIIRHFVYFLRALELGRKSDVIFAQDPVSVGLPSLLAAKILRKKFALKIVGDYAWEQYQNNLKSQISNLKTLEDFQKEKFDFMTELRRKTERFVAKNADKIIVPSQYLKKIIMMWSVPEDKINVIYNSFDPVRSRTQTQASAASNGVVGLSGFILISVGRLVPWKGFGALIEIMPEIIKEIPDAKLFIIGSGPEREALKLQITNYKLQKNIFLVGKLSHEDLLSYLRAGDIFVLNTGYEGFSHLILESMAMGIPVITTNVGGNPEIIQSRENGILIEYNNKEQLKQAIISLYKNPESRKKITENAKIKVKEFSKEKMIKETIQIW